MGIKVQKPPGFTLVEVIACLIIFGIITAFVINHFATNNTNLVAQTEVIKSHLRYAQSLAMNSDVIWGVCSTGPSYWLFRDGNTGSKVALPGEDSDTVDLAGRGVSLESLILSFNSWGRPYTDGAASNGQELDTGDPECEITVTSRGRTRSITVTPSTGFIP